MQKSQVAAQATPAVLSTALGSTSTPTTEETAVQKPADVQPLDRYSLIQKWLHPDRHYVGLVNLGNSCFMSSVLQVLLHTQPLMNVIQTNHARLNCKRLGHLNHLDHLDHTPVDPLIVLIASNFFRLSSDTSHFSRCIEPRGKILLCLSTQIAKLFDAWQQEWESKGTKGNFCQPTQ